VPATGLPPPVSPDNPQNTKDKQAQPKHGFFDKLKSIFH
jgi:hypothetical protein